VAEDLHQLGVELGAASFPRHRHRRVDPAGATKNLDDVGEVDEPRGAYDLGALEPVCPLPVPAFVAQVTNALAQFGVLQIINTGTGTVQGFGPATMVLSITQDHDVTPCGPGSSTNAAIRRITLAQGVLVEEELAIACPTPSGGLIITGTYQVDGRSSTGLFAGARGEGTLTAETTVNPPTSTLSGKLFLARPLG
jgi:hypothetical protein